MAPGARQEVYIIIKPGSNHTLVQLVGNVENAFNPPHYSIPTQVYYSEETNQYAAEPFAGDLPSQNKILHPIVRGSIVDLQAFQHFLLFVYKSLVVAENLQSLKETSVPSTVDALAPLVSIPMICTFHHSATKTQMEKLTQFFFENIGVNSLMFLPSGMSSLYAFANNNNGGNGVVVDIGAEKFDLIPICDFVVQSHLCYTSKIGGNSINEQLSLKLGWKTPESIENLKKSDIFEVLPDYNIDEIAVANKSGNTDPKDVDNNLPNKFLDGNLQEDEEADETEGVMDIAEIVTSGKDTRKLLEEREKSKSTKKNSELEENVFYDVATQQMLTVGKERFSGCGKLLKQISLKLGRALSQVPDLNKRRALWENIVLVGNTASITGFKDVLLKRLIHDHLIQEPEAEFKNREEAFYANATKKKGRYVGHVIALDYMNQIPISIKINKIPEYFPQWKKFGYGEIEFLGAQIVARQVFSHYNEQYFVTREKYNEAGPMSCWAVSM